MSKLTQDAIRDSRARNLVAEDSASISDGKTVYVGSALMFVSGTGRVETALTASNPVGNRPAGICTRIINETGTQITVGTGDANGNVKAEFEYGGEWLFAVDAFARSGSNVGSNVYLLTDNDIAAGQIAGTGSVKIGSISSFANSTRTLAWVRVRDFGDRDA